MKLVSVTNSALYPCLVYEDLADLLLAHTKLSCYGIRRQVFNSFKFSNCANLGPRKLGASVFFAKIVSVFAPHIQVVVRNTSKGKMGRLHTPRVITAMHYALSTWNDLSVMKLIRKTMRHNLDRLTVLVFKKKLPISLFVCGPKPNPAGPSFPYLSPESLFWAPSYVRINSFRHVVGGSTSCP